MIPRYLVNFDLDKIKKEFYPIIIIGSGVAGLSAALNAAKNNKVLVLTKDKIKECNTQYAQGGIAVALSPNDSPLLHYKDTITAGAGLCKRNAAKILVEEGLLRVNELIKDGAKFSKELGREAAHTHNRILHAKGYSTGEEVERILVKNVRKNKNITIIEDVFVIDIITYKGKSYGVISLDKKNNLLTAFFSQAIILTTGGIGQIYKYTTNPKIATGDGMAMAYRAGCELSDLEFIQFHPTSLFHIKRRNPLFLISEVVRGEGGKLLNKRLERFMYKYHPLKELAPRDIVARAIVEEMHKENSQFVFLDLREIKDVEKKFPCIYQNCKKVGIDIRKELIPVAPSAHYIMGGIKSTLCGGTNISGIYTAGEVACTGIHGANRLASNSILEGLVFGQRAANFALKYLEKNKNKIEKISIKHNKQKKIGKYNFAKTKDKIQELLWENVGIIRSEKGLKKAFEEIDKMKNLLEFELLHAEGIELQNMIILSSLIIKQAILREESRGVHYRIDYPERNDEKWRKHIIIKR